MWRHILRYLHEFVGRVDLLVHQGIWFLLTLNVLIAEQGHFGERRAWRGPFCLAPTHLSEHQVAAGRSWEQGHDAPGLSLPSLPTYSHQVVRPKPSSLSLQLGVFLHRSLLLGTYFGNTAKTTILQSHSNADLPSASQCHHCWVSTKSHRRQERTEKRNLKRAVLEGTSRLVAYHKKSSSTNQSGLFPGVNIAQVLCEFSESFY